MIKKGYAKHFQQGRLDLDNGLISYYYTPRTAKVREIRLKVVPVKFISEVMSEYHVSPLSCHRHEQRIVFRILAQFWWPVVNK